MAFLVPFVATRRSFSATSTRNQSCFRHDKPNRTSPIFMRNNDDGEPRRPRRVRRREHGMNTVTRAQRLAQRGDFEQARGLLRAHVRKTPANARAWLALAQMERNDEDALQVFAEGATYCPTSAHLLHAWAVRAGRSGYQRDARRLFRSCIRLAPRDALAWQAYAILEEKARDIALARSLFTVGAMQAPKSAHLWSAWGALERRENRHDVAVKYLAAAIAINPRHIGSLQMWALSAESLGEHKMAKSLFERALDVNQGSVPTLQAYALFNARRGNIGEARELFSKAAKLDPRHAPVWHAWATMERKMGDTERARELFDTGVRARPYSAPMLRGWAAMELELGHIDSSPEWRVNGTGTRRSLGENLQMLRLLLERRSNDDVATVMKWLDRRANVDRDLYDRFTERGSSDSRLLKDWIGRRSSEDIEAFKGWFAEHYERDRLIGTYILNWDIPPLQPAVKEIPIVENNNGPPREWYVLAEMPVQTLEAHDKELFYNGSANDYASGVYFLGMIANNFADRAALVFMLGSLSLLLVGVSASLEKLGYIPVGEKASLSGEETIIAPRSGVDAYLYENDIDMNELNSAGGSLYKRIR